MEKEFVVKENGITLRTAVPLLNIVGMSIEIRENEHGKGQLEAVVREEYAKEILHMDFGGKEIAVEEESGNLLFDGFFETAEFRVENGYVSLRAEFVSRSILLDREKKCRSFQRIEMTYEQVAAEVVNDYSDSGYFWKTKPDCQICFPVIQYEETDWELMIRLASHFHTVVYPGYRSRRTLFLLGTEKGKKQELESGHILKWGIGDNYYSEGCYGEGKSRRGSVYIEARGGMGWDIGDVAEWEGLEYMVFRKNILFEKGETVCTYLLGRDCFAYRKRKRNENLRGVRLTGIVRKSERENVWIQPDMDKEEKADYPWAWVPETGNLCYCMPEAGTEAVLYFPSGEEREGIALHALRKDRESKACGDIQHREFRTQYGRKAGLYPDRLLLEGKDSNVSLTMEDGRGICFSSGQSMVLEAAGEISINGKKCSSCAPMEILYQASQSNIEICRDFNFYAINGVQTDGKTDGDIMDLPEVSDGSQAQEHWQISFVAMAAVPAADVSGWDEDSMTELAACGAVPKMAGGRQVLAMKDTMAGKSGKDVRFPEALQGMEIYTVKGGYAVPEEGND